MAKSSVAEKQLSFFDTLPPAGSPLPVAVKTTTKPSEFSVTSTNRALASVAEQSTPAPADIAAFAVNTPLSTVSDLLPSYEKYLRGSKKSEHTVGSFTGDIRKLMLFLKDPQISVIGTQDLQGFLSDERSEGAADTTLYRKYTTLKNYFKWLYEVGILPTNIADSLSFTRADSPLPEILTGEEADRFIEASRETPQEHIVALLLLGAGLKRSELMALILSDINISDPVQPIVRIRSKHIFKNRNVVPPVEFVNSCRQYIADRWQLLPGDREGWSGKDVETGALDSMVFSLTERTLNYLIESIAERAGIKKKVSAQILRDTFAVLLLKAGESMDSVLSRLGLALTECNNNIRAKYRKLAELTK